MILKTDIQGNTFLNGRKINCSVGFGGVGIKGKEGDNITPIGLWQFEQVFYRADRVQKPETILPISVIQPCDGWCDDPLDLNYNKPIQTPYLASHEKLWRDDAVYDLVISTSYNRNPIIPNQGSAIFIHLNCSDNQGHLIPTAGCLGLYQADLLELLSLITQNSHWQVG